MTLTDDGHQLQTVVLVPMRGEDPRTEDGGWMDWNN